MRKIAFSHVSENNMLSINVAMAMTMMMIIMTLLELLNLVCSTYILNGVFHSEMVLYFISVYVINRTLHGHLKMRSLVKYPSTLQAKFRILARACDILDIFCISFPATCTSHWFKLGC